MHNNSHAPLSQTVVEREYIPLSFCWSLLDLLEQECSLSRVVVVSQASDDAATLLSRYIAPKSDKYLISAMMDWNSLMQSCRY